jgi:hypothetical protein
MTEDNDSRDPLTRHSRRDAIRQLLAIGTVASIVHTGLDAEVPTTNSALPEQEPDKLVGTWKLVSASATSASGVVDKTPYGSNLSGTLIYTAERRVTVLLSYGDRKTLSGSDRVTAPAAERAEAFATFFAYAGRYSVAGDRVIHHVDIASYPNWVNTDFVRIFAFSGERLTLRTPPLYVGGTMQTSDLVWERLRPGEALLRP